MSSRPSQFPLTTPGPLRLYSTTELLALPAPTWQVEGMIPSGGLVGLYGAPGHGKTFVALDLALCLATGQPWQGRVTRSGWVVYVSAEGGTGIGKRVLAWLTHRHMAPCAARVAWLTEVLSVNPVSHTEDIDRLIERIDGEVQETPVLIVLDTLARCFEGNENQQEDMGRFVRQVDRLRQEFQATVLIVHHMGVAGDRERGSTSFRGAADTMLRCTRLDGHGPIHLFCDKQKDAEEFARLEGKLIEVAETDSCVIRWDSVTEGELDGDIMRIVSQANSPLQFAEILTNLPKETQTAHGVRRRVFRALSRLVRHHEIRKIVKENERFPVYGVKGVRRVTPS